MKKKYRKTNKNIVKNRKGKTRKHKKQRGGGVSYVGSLLTFIASVGASVGINEYLKN